MSVINLGNFGGTLWHSKTPLCEFKFRNDRLDDTAVKVLCYEPFLIPLPMLDYFNNERWHLFFDSQCVPSTRHRIDEDLLKTGVLTSYNPEQILRYTKGRNDANHYWVDCDNDTSCWEPWQIAELRRTNRI